MIARLFAACFATAALASAQSSPPYWAESRTIAPHVSDSYKWSRFGACLGLDGDRIAVGAPRASNGLGKVLVYMRSGFRWIPQPGNVIIPTMSSGNEKGTDLDLTGDELMVGAPGWNPSGSALQGAVHYLVRGAGIWNTIQTLEPSAPSATSMYFGRALARDGDTLVIGAHNDDALAPRSGSAYVFEKDGAGIWIERAKIVGSDSVADDYFGYDVAIDGDTIAVRSEVISFPADDGSVYLFVRDDAGTPGDPADDAWIEQTKLVGTSGDQFGSDIDLEQDRLVIGEMWNDDGGNDAGAAYVYERSGNVWTQSALFYASDAQPDDHFGESVELSGNRLLVAAPGRDSGAEPNTGKVFLFEYDGATWREIQTLVDPIEQGNTEFGLSLAFDGTERIEIGAPSHYINNEVAGLFVTFRLDSGYSTFCYGDGSAGPCPCNNPAPAGEGCDHGAQLFPQGARLRPFGSSSIAAGELTFVADQLPYSADTGLLFGGPTLVNNGAGIRHAGGQGLRCIGQPLRRFGLSTADGYGSMGWGPSFVNVPWSAGQTWYFQTWYRDNYFTCGVNTNVSSGTQVTFLP